MNGLAIASRLLLVVGLAAATPLSVCAQSAAAETGGSCAMASAAATSSEAACCPGDRAAERISCCCGDPGPVEEPDERTAPTQPPREALAAVDFRRPVASVPDVLTLRRDWPDPDRAGPRGGLTLLSLGTLLRT